MQTTTYITERGNLTLPAQVRKELGITGKSQVIIETNDKGEIILRPAISIPIEYYTEERIGEFFSDDKKLEKILDKIEK